MRLNVFLLCILFLVTTSFFWEDEEKQLRQLHQNGEAAFRKKEFEEAKSAYEELVNRVSINSTKKYSVDWPTYIDLVQRLASIYENLKEHEEAAKVLEALLQKNPPECFVASVQLMQTRLKAAHVDPAQSYKTMREIAETYPTESWNNKDLSFYRALEYSLNHFYSESLQKAKRFLTAGFYTEAQEIYQQVLEAIEEGNYPKAHLESNLMVKNIRYHLAECHFLSAEYEKTLALCDQSSAEDKIDREMLYLAALCFREKNEYEKALPLLQNYTQSAEQSELTHLDHALFEIGCFYYQHKNYTKAKESFEKLRNKKSKPGLVSSLYLARIFLDEGAYIEVEPLLKPLKKAFGAKDPFRFESFYLRGLAAYALRNWEHAYHLFEHSLASALPMGQWQSHALYHLGWCCIHLWDDNTICDETKKHLFTQAEKAFNRLLSTYPESASLSLAQLNILSFKHFEDPKALEKVFALLDTISCTFSHEGELHALLLCAEASPTFAKKEEILSRATDEKFQHAPLYAQAWHCRGLNYFQEGLKHPEAHHKFFELATTALEKAFQYAENQDPQHAARILKLEAKAFLYQNAPTETMALLDRLLNQYDESTDEREETLYLRGLIASRLGDDAHFPLAQQALRQVIDIYPKGKYRGDALYVLATLHFRQQDYTGAKDLFLQLAKDLPEHIQAADAWYWAAEAAEKLREDASYFRQQVYERYPNSLHADDAYFRQFTYSAYLSGAHDALKHLQAFQTYYPKSPLRILVHYLIGIHESNFEKAKRRFEQALQTFDEYFCQTTQPSEIYLHARYQSMLALANRILEKTPSDTTLLLFCEEILTSLVADFSASEHPFTANLKLHAPYPPLYEEGEFRLAQCFLLQGKNYYAQKQFSLMLSHYSEAGITHGLFLSRVWHKLGEMALKCGDVETALNCFDSANECGEGFLSDDQMLSLWIDQSHCFREKKEYDTAMRYLSKVINSETASPLRLKAMFLRAEIYELEGRPELAMRQLEATAKKGGEWAHQARDKLKVEYGVQ